MDQLSSVKIDPVLFLRCQLAVGGNFHRRYKTTVRRTATCTEQHHMTARARQGTGGDGIVARCAQQVQAMRLQAFAVAQYVHHLTGACFLRTAQRFIFQRGDTARFVARRWVLVDRLVVGNEVLLEVINHGDQLAERFFIAAVVHQQLLGAEHFRHFGQHCSSAVSNHVVGETAQHRVGGNTGEAVRAAAFQTKLQLAQLTRFTLIVTHHVVQLVKMFNPRFHFVFLVLADHEVNAIRIVLA